jgi:glutamate-1-semialdehyde aminotransferase
MVFVKTGSDATTTGIRVARAFTKRLKILRCGYHGWHDWAIGHELDGGIPKKFFEDVHEFEFNNLNQVEELMKKYGDDVAAIITTPVDHPGGHKVKMPDTGFLEGLRKIANEYGALLMYDEIRTGFRFDLGGAQKFFGVIPDLAAFGKAMANGYPISFLGGKQKVMDVLIEEVFLSSTYFPNSLAQIASLKTIEILEREKVLDNISKKGNDFSKKVIELIEDTGVPCNFSGGPWMPYITFERDPNLLYKKLREEFYTQLIRRKVFLQPFHHGYICYRHTNEDLDHAVDMISESLNECKRMIK